MIDGKHVFDQPIKSYIKTYDNIRKITTGQSDDHAISCLLDYNYFKNIEKMIAIDLSKQEALDADRNTIQQINFTGNLRGANDRVMPFFNEEVKKKKHFRFFTRNCESVVILFCFNIISR